MNAREPSSDWLQQVTLDGVTEVRVDVESMDLTLESDESLHGVAQLIVEPAQHAPVLRQSGSELLLEQQGRYRGRVTPLLRLPAGVSPPLNVSLGKGDLTVNETPATLAISVGMGDVVLRGGSGEIALRLGKGDVVIKDRPDAVAVQVGMGDVAIKQCAGNLAIDVGKGDVACAHCGADIEVRLGSGDVTIGNPGGGRVSIVNGNGDIAVGGGSVRGLRIRNGRGDIASATRLLLPPDTESVAQDDDMTFNVDDFVDDFLEGFDVANLNLGDLEFEASEAGVRIARGNQDILRLGPEGIRINRKGRSVSLGPGGIRVGGSSVPGAEPFSFETGKGDIRVDIPSDLPLRVEVLATGDVQSDLPLVSVGRPGPRGTTKRLVGVRDAGDSGPRANVRVKTGRGDVALRTVQVAAEPPARPESKTETERDERARVILEALSRGDLSVGEAERLLAALDRSG